MLNVPGFVDFDKISEFRGLVAEPPRKFEAFSAFKFVFCKMLSLIDIVILIPFVYDLIGKRRKAPETADQKGE